ncbi:uncharacterized protein GJ701_002175 [Geothlypis trichas]
MEPRWQRFEIGPRPIMNVPLRSAAARAGAPGPAPGRQQNTPSERARESEREKERGERAGRDNGARGVRVSASASVSESVPAPPHAPARCCRRERATDSVAAERGGSAQPPTSLSPWIAGAGRIGGLRAGAGSRLSVTPARAAGCFQRSRGLLRYLGGQKGAFGWCFFPRRIKPLPPSGRISRTAPPQPLPPFPLSRRPPPAPPSTAQQRPAPPGAAPHAHPCPHRQHPQPRGGGGRRPCRGDRPRQGGGAGAAAAAAAAPRGSLGGAAPPGGFPGDDGGRRGLHGGIGSGAGRERLCPPRRHLWPPAPLLRNWAGLGGAGWGRGRGRGRRGGSSGGRGGGSLSPGICRLPPLPGGLLEWCAAAGTGGRRDGASCGGLTLWRDGTATEGHGQPDCFLLRDPPRFSAAHVVFWLLLLIWILRKS